MVSGCQIKRETRLLIPNIRFIAELDHVKKQEAKEKPLETKKTE